MIVLKFDIGKKRCKPFSTFSFRSWVFRFSMKGNKRFFGLDIIVRVEQQLWRERKSGRSDSSGWVIFSAVNRHTVDQGVRIENQPISRPTGRKWRRRFATWKFNWRRNAAYWKRWARPLTTVMDKSLKPTMTPTKESELPALYAELNNLWKNSKKKVCFLWYWFTKSI